MEKPRFLFVTFLAHGQLNPGLQFAKLLLQSGAGEVTFPTTAAGLRHIPDDVPDGITFPTYSGDGYEDAFVAMKGDLDRNVSEHERRCSEAVAELITSARRAGRPYACLVYTTLIPWAGRVAREHHVPSALLWIQPAAVISIYYHYYNGFCDVLRNAIDDPSCSAKLPGLPPLNGRDLPSYLHPSYTGFARSALQKHMQLLREEADPKVIVNTFDELEMDALRAVSGLDLIAVGPLAFFDNKQPKKEAPSSCKQWLDSKAAASVIYVSFGSYSVLPKAQTEEMARALLESGKPFLWVIRELADEDKGSDNNEEEEEGEVTSCREELEKAGMIVPWCYQLEVLSHPAVACFVTHCGWNSTLESLGFGVPMVGIPFLTDQATNAKLIEEVWKVGVRAGSMNEDGVVESGEIGRCLEMVMGGGERGAEMKRNALKWKAVAREAVSEGGSSVKNLRAFMEGLSQG